MDIKDFKAGETYNVRVKVKYIEGYNVVAATIGPDGKEGYRTRFLFGDLPAFSPISPENGIKNTEPAPKYDPNRKFREGDKVRVIEKDGRTVHDPLNGGIWRVARNERTGGSHEMSVLVHLIYEGEKTTHQISVPFCFLELVTPVEELEPYSVGETTDYFSVDKDDEELSLYWKDKHPHAKAAAEAERDRLNAEWRKEQE